MGERWGMEKGGGRRNERKEGEGEGCELFLINVFKNAKKVPQNTF